MVYKHIRNYYSLIKPGIIYGNLLTALAGYILGKKDHFHLNTLLLLLLSTSLVIASACVFNNILDKNIDAKMSRTKKRELVTEKIPLKHAYIFGIIMAVTGFALIRMYLNNFVLIIGLIAFLDYVVIYGFLKRRSHHGTLAGTIAGSASIAAGYAAATDTIDTTAILLILFMTAWQMVHFYAIAIYRLSDYENAGIPVLPSSKGLKRTNGEMILYSLLLLISVILLYVYSFNDFIFISLMGALSIYWIILSVQGLKFENKTNWATKMFIFSLIIILAFCLVIYKSLFVSNLTT